MTADRFTRRLFLAALFAAGSMAVTVNGAAADDDDQADDNDDSDRDRDRDRDRQKGKNDERQRDALQGAVDDGEVRPLADILATVRAAVPGRVVSVEAEEEDGRWLYEIKVVGANGRRREVMVDGATGRILEID